jgi:TonB family protein
MTPSGYRSVPVRIFDEQPRRPSRRLPKALTFSLAAHICTAVVVGLIVGRHPNLTGLPLQRSSQPDNLVWLSRPGLTGGGGGRDATPARRARQVGTMTVTVPARGAPDLEPRTAPQEPAQEQPIAIPALPLASGVQVVPGALQALSDPEGGSQTSGNGRNRGSGTGNDAGIGDGPRGMGDGPGGSGSGVTGPQLVRQVRPNYTGEAMRARIEGTVALEAVVMADGSVGDVKVVRSFDPDFGLNQEAIRTVKLWRFIPGSRRGQAVPVAVNVELTFRLR